MADNEYTTKLRLEADLSGGVATEKQYDQLVAKAKELGRSGKSGAAEAAAGINNLSKTVGFLRKALAGFGVVGLFTGLISSINKIKESFGAAQKQAEEMAKIQKQLDESKHIQNLAAQYDQLKDSAEKAAAAQNAALEQIDTDVSNSRRLDKAKMNAAKQEELAALDPNDEYYAEKVAQIEAKYSGMSANMEASNAREDIVLERQKLGTQAEQKDQAAAVQDAESAKIRAQLNQAKMKQNAAQLGSVDLNEADKGGVLDTIGKTLGQIFTGKWGRAAGATTEEGDKIRQAKAKEAAEAELKVADLQEQLRKSEEKAAALRTEAGNIRTKRDSLGVALEAADIEAETARRQGDIGVEKADTAMQKKREQVAKDSWAEGQKEADRIAQETDATPAKALLEKQMPETQRQIYLQKQRIAAADASVAQAQAAYDTATGSAKGSAAQRLQQVTQTAAETKDEANRLIKQLQETLSGMKSVMTAATSELKKNNSQRLTEQAQQYVAQ